MRARVRAVGVVLLAVASTSCGDSPSGPTPTLQLVLIGPDTFWIDDTAAVNPGCHYWWTIRATGAPSVNAELMGGRIFTSLDLEATPVDTSYVWDSLTIQPLFGTPRFQSGEVRQSGPYASVSQNLPEMRKRVEFDYVVYPGGAKGLLTQEFYCLRE